ncbi:MAG: AAA family ATPase [Thermoanaerobacteraceae bacterium]|nr:AAA family ATPase [Thermoanaerobacteraceae bacterium]
MTPLLIKGQAGSGKTTYLINKLMELTERHSRTDEILFFTLNKPNMNHIRKNIDLVINTGINITTFPRFITEELMLFWPAVLENCSRIEVKEPQPVLIDALTAHEIMRKIVERLQREGAFLDIKATSDSISLEIMHNFSRAVSSLIDYHDISNILISSHPNKNPIVYKDMEKALDEYIDLLLSHGLIDYGLTAYLYNNFLRDTEIYRKQFEKRFKYLFVDNLEESNPSMVSFISSFLNSFEEAYLAFSTDGGYSMVLGASPSYALNELEGRCSIEDLDKSYTSSESMINLSNALQSNINDGTFNIVSSPVRLVECEYKSDMVYSAVEEVKKLISAGFKPGDISLIAPYLDPVTEELLISGLKASGIPAFPLTNTGRLIDQPFISNAVTLTLLAHPWWDIHPTHSELKDTFTACFDMDPVRASILADFVEGKNTLSHLDQKTIMRIGFNSNDKYERLLDWLSTYTEEIPIDSFLEKLLWDYLIPLPAAGENIMATKMLIDMASGYIKIMEVISPGKMYGRDFITSVKRGVKGIEILEEMPDDAVIIATPYSYLMNPLASKVQIWLDASDKDWEDNGVRPLSNPYVFLPEWNGIWTTYTEELYSRYMLSNRIVNLLKRCRDSLIVIDCHLTPRFTEQNGMLMEYLQNTCRIIP